MEPCPSFTAKQLRNIIEGKRSYERIPMLYNFWADSERFIGHEEEAEDLMRLYPYDVQTLDMRMPDPIQAPEDDPSYKWLNLPRKADETRGLDARTLIEDWEAEGDEVFAHFPSPEYPGLFERDPAPTQKYRLVNWWYCFFERLWQLRGMENALTDFYLCPDKVHTLFRHLTDFYMRLIERAHDELHADGVFTSDDIGTQKAPFFSEAIFLEFFKPYYKELVDKAHSLDMHFWLHTCGNIEKFIPHFIEIGLDVLHPIQKYTMDGAEIARKYGGQLCIWAGFDVQQVIPFGTPEQVREEVRCMIDTYARKDGRFMLTCGNGLTSDCKIDSFRALLDESYHYGTQKMKKLNAQSISFES